MSGRLLLLDETDRGVDENHTENDGGVQPITEKRLDDSGSDQDVDERWAELEKESQERPAPLLDRHLIQAELVSSVLYRENIQAKGRSRSRAGPLPLVQVGGANTLQAAGSSLLVLHAREHEM